MVESTFPVIINYHDALLDMCLRNALKYAQGEIPYTRELGDQLVFAYQHCNDNTKKVLKSIFRDMGILD